MEKESDEDSTSKDDMERFEMRWNKKIEALLEEWCAESIERSNQHYKKGKCKQCSHYLLSIPTIMLPFLVVTANIIYDDYFINNLGHVCSGMLTGIATLINLPSQYEQHFNADSRYEELSTEIQSILVQPKRNRVQADVTLEHIKNRFEYINKTSIHL